MTAEATPCSGCGAAMERAVLEANYGRTVAVDLCHACAALWFDAGESLALTPGATLALFERIHARTAERAGRAVTAPACARCRHRLVETNDRQRNTRFRYFRCAQGHGRFIAFAEFLREKNFVRPLDARELAELRAHVRSVQCSSCGAGVDLEQGSACTYCRAPLSMLDPRQVERMLRDLQSSEVRRTTVDPQWPARVAMDRLEIERLWEDIEAADGGARFRARGGLLEAGIAVVASAFLGRGR